MKLISENSNIKRFVRRFREFEIHDKFRDEISFRELKYQEIERKWDNIQRFQISRDL